MWRLSLKGLKNPVSIWLLALSLVACQSKPEIRYVTKTEYVNVYTAPQLTQMCSISQRQGDKVIDYIMSERKLRNDLVICNMIIEERNKHEQDLHKELSSKGKEK